LAFVKERFVTALGIKGPELFFNNLLSQQGFDWTGKGAASPKVKNYRFWGDVSPFDDS